MTQIQSYPQTYLVPQRTPESNGVKIELISPQQGECCPHCCHHPMHNMPMTVPIRAPVQAPVAFVQPMPMSISPQQAILYATTNAPMLNNFPPRPVPSGVVYNYSHTDVYHAPVHVAPPQPFPVREFVNNKTEINKPVIYSPFYSKPALNVGLPEGHPPIWGMQKPQNIEKKAPSIENKIVEVKEMALPESSKPVERLDISPIANSLKSSNPQEQFEGLKMITDMSQNPEVPKDLLLRGDVFDNVAEIITKENKTDEKAKMNEVYATYTLGAVQKNFRSSVTEQTNKQGMQPVQLNELPHIDVIINNAKSHSNPMVQQASIETLAYLREPQDKEELNKIYQEASKSNEATVQMSAKIAMDENNK